MSTRTSSNSRKRKADVDDSLSSGRKLKLTKPSPSSSSPAAHLPASCLAAILNFMEYGEVRRCLLAGKIMAVDAARHVEVLNIMNASELVPSAARRFANVSEVNILSLITPNEVADEDTLSAETATRSVPFLISFPKLKRAFLGGVYLDPEDEEWMRIPYLHIPCTAPKDHQSVFRGLVDYLSGAFRSRSLSPTLHLEGIVEEDQLDCNEDYEREVGHCCRQCRNIITSFPLEMVLKEIHESALCLDFSDCVDALASRHDNPSISDPQAVTRCFLTMTKHSFTTRTMYVPVPYVAGTCSDFDEKMSFAKRIKSQGGEIVGFGGDCGVSFWFILDPYMETLKRFAAFIGPSAINSVRKIEFLSAVRPLGEVRKDGKKSVLVRQTFDSLVQLGFELASKDFVLIDPLKEAALRDYHDMFRSEEEDS